MQSGKKLFERRRNRVRTSLRKVANGRARLSIHRTNQHIYAQVIDDEKGVTLAMATSRTAEVSKGRKSSKNREAASAVGRLVAERALKAGVKQVVFDRAGLMYHGRVKAVAEAARKAGLKV